MKIQLVCDIEKCSACAACAVACMDQNDIDAARSDAPRRRIALFELPGGGVTYASLSCLHCEDAPCVAACPTGCLYKDADTGLTLYDTDKCIACHSCALACPCGAPCFDAEGRINKCDGCIDRLRAGLEPACSRVCPAGALECLSVEDDAPGLSKNAFGVL